VAVAAVEIQKLLQQGVDKHRAGQRDVAARLYHRVLTLDPNQPDALNLAGVVEFQNGNLQQAEHWMTLALCHSENNATFLNNLAAVQLQKKDFEAAIVTAQRSIAAQSRNPDAKKHLSSALQQAGDFSAGIAVAEDAVQDAPDNTQLKVHLGTIQLAARRPADALATLIAACDPNVSNAVLDLHLGAAQRQLGLYSDALQSLNRALAAQPDLPAALINRGNSLASLNRPEEALLDFQKALQIQPKSATALSGLGKTLQILGHWAESLEALRLAWMCDDQQRGFDSSYLYGTSLAPNLTRRQVADIHAAWGQAVEQLTTAYVHGRSDKSKARLTIGYVSPDFCSHATMRFFLPLLQHHNREQFRIACYSENPREDSVTEKIKTSCDLWRPTISLTDDELAAQIVRDDVDILIDLAGHTAGNRLRVFARQPAPVQASFLGYPCTTGLNRIQWFLSDRFRENEQTRTCFSERLFFLPRSACCFEMGGSIPDIVEPPCLKTGYVTLGSTHRLEKLSPGCLELWGRVMRRIPNARLRICRDVLGSSEEFRRKLLQRLNSAGIAESRVDFQWEFGGNHLNVYSEIDILLDVFPWGSGTTAWECTWLGVPIPTIQDCEKSSAATASLLMNCGFPELVAANDSGYVDIIERLCRHPDELLRLRFALQPAMASTVCDVSQYARDFESSMRRLWQIHCDQIEDKSATISQGERS
jgi:protein O-GlcNAc transferase